VTELAPGRNFTRECRSLGVRVLSGHVIKGLDGGRSAVALTVHQNDPVIALARFGLNRRGFDGDPLRGVLGLQDVAKPVVKDG
jgi:hypothetical protein